MNTNRNPKVSIVIPVYNGSNYLKEAIDSALAQTYKNIEVIVINDGSTDNGATEKIAKSYGEKIRYFKKKNGGVATALNLGIKKMTGEYFSWLSHDDLYYPNKIEAQVKYIQKLQNKEAVLYSDYSILKDDKFSTIEHNHEMLTRKPKYSLLRGCVNGITMLIPKVILDEFGFFDERLKTTQDYSYWLKIQQKYSFIHMTEILSVTRIHSSQDSQTSLNVVLEADLLWIDMIESLTEEEIEKYEITKYNYYYQMMKFLKTTPYKGALDYCAEKLKSLEEVYELNADEFKVSVIIPFYNRVDQAIRSIRSVLNQSYNNIEIILVNDASTENIDKLIKLVKTERNIILINMQKNSGPAAARNAGIRAATGQYIAFLDSDDEFVRFKLDYQLREMKKYNSTISFTPYIRRDSDGDNVMRDSELSGLVVPRIIYSCTIATPTVIVKRDFLLKNSISFIESIRIGEDVCYWLEIAKRSEIHMVDVPLTIVNTNNHSNAYDANKLAIGLKNILSYLITDPYYSQPAYHYPVSILSSHFHILNQQIKDVKLDLVNKENEVLMKNFSATSRGDKKASKIRKIKEHNKPYRFLRTAYYDGIKKAVSILFE